MKLITIVIFFSLVTQRASAQPRLSIDSLKNQLTVVKTDTTRVLLLLSIGSQYLLSDPKTSEKYFQEGLVLSRSLNYRKGEADCLRFIGNAFKRQGQYPRALNNILQAMAISEHIRDSSGIAAALGHIGDIYSEQGDHYKARQYFFRAKKIDESIHKDPEHLLMLLNIGKSYQRQNVPDSAMLFLKQCFNLAMKAKNEWLMDGLLTTLGQVEANVGNDDEAIIYFRKSIPYSLAKHAYLNLSDTYLGIASLYKKSGATDSCIIYGKKSLSSAQNVNYVKGIMASSQVLSEVYDDINKDEALKYYRTAMIAKDSLFNAEKVRQLQNLGYAEQQRLEALEDAKLEYRNKMRSYTLLLLVGAFLVIAIVQFINNRNKQKANVVLRQQKEEIQRTLTELKMTQVQLIQSEKMASLGELTAGIAHEIQNPLNFVNNFSEVNKELLSEMKEEIEKGNLEDAKSIAGTLIDNQEKIANHGKRADAIVKGMLQHSRSSSGVKESTNVNTLVDEYVRLAYHGFRAKDKSFNVTLKTNFDEGVSTINIVPQDIGRVILNLLNNAFYAVNVKKDQAPAGYEPTVSVSTKKSHNAVLISIADNGNGIPEEVVGKIFQPFFTTKPTGQGTGLGLSLSYDIVKAHGGELKVETKEGEGSEFVIHLPVS
jgi:two-component system, NtrC family, sensor kinase